MGRVKDGYRQFAKLINEVAEAKQLITGWDRVIQFVVEGEGDFYIQTQEEVLHLTKERVHHRM